MVNFMGNKRLCFLDILKGIGIILVIIGHSHVQSRVGDLIYSFHMPLFFFLSGILFDAKKDKHVVDLLKRRLFTIIVPYIIFYIFLLLFQTYIEVPLYDYKYVNFTHQLVGLFYGSPYKDFMLFNAIWFLPTLISVEVVYYAVQKRVKLSWLKIFIIFMLFGVGCFLGKRGLSLLPWGMTQALVVLPFYMLGHYLHPVIQKCANSEFAFLCNYREKVSRYIAPFFFAVLFIVLYIFLPTDMDIKSAYISPLISGVLVAFAGVLFMVSVSIWIRNCSWIEFIGRNTLIIIPIHQPLLRLYDFGFHSVSIGRDFALRYSTIYPWVIALLALLSCLPFIFLWRNTYMRRIYH